MGINKRRELVETSCKGRVLTRRLGEYLESHARKEAAGTCPTPPQQLRAHNLSSAATDEAGRACLPLVGRGLPVPQDPFSKRSGAGPPRAPSHLGCYGEGAFSSYRKGPWLGFLSLPPPEASPLCKGPAFSPWPQLPSLQVLDQKAAVNRDMQVLPSSSSFYNQG